PLLGLADLAARAMAAGQADVEGLSGDDGADVHAVTLGRLGVAHPPKAVAALHDAAEAIVSFQGVAAGGDEIDDAFVVFPREVGVGGAVSNLVVKSFEIE